MRRLAAITLAISALGCNPGGGNVLAPPIDTCSVPSPGSVDQLDVGAATPDDLDGIATTFTPLVDGDGVPLIRGSQGGTMIGLILRVSGASAPSCLSQQTTVTDSGGARVTAATSPLTTYAQPDGTRLTHPLWMPANYPATFLVGVVAANQSLALHLHLK